MNIGFVAGTPLQIINLINIQQTFFRNDNIVVFIQDDFANSEMLILKLRETIPSFNVIKIDMEKFNKNSTKLKIDKYLNRDHIYNGTLDQLFIPSDMKYVRQIFGHQKKKNPNLLLMYYEDGLSAYVRDEVLYKSRFDILFNKYSIEKYKFSKYYVYEPSLVVVGEENEKIKIQKLNKFNPALNIIKKVFSNAYNILEERQEREKNKLIYFDQQLQESNFSLDEKDIYNEISKICLDLNIPLEVKLHPRSAKDKYGQAKVLETELPWEVYLLFNDISNIILVSVFSTTIYSPFFLFDMDIPVISLVNLISNERDLDEFTLQIISNIIELNSRIKMKDSLTIMTPEEKDELQLLFDFKKN